MVRVLKVDALQQEKIELNEKVARQKIELESALAASEEEARRAEMIFDAFEAKKWTYEIGADDTVVSMKMGRLLDAFDPNIDETPDKWIDLLHEDDREAVLEAFYAAIRDHSCATMYDVIYRAHDMHGNWHWVHSIGKMMRREDGTGEFFGFVANLDSELERKEAFDRLNAISRYLMGSFASVYYCGYNEGFTLVHSSDALLALLKDKGIDSLPAKLPPGRYKETLDWLNILTVPADEQQYINRMLDADYLRDRLAREPSFTFNTKCIIGTKNGEYRVHVTRVVDADHWVIGFVDITREVLREREQQKILEDALDEAQAANRAKSAFLFSMSHDVRTPMNAILGFTNMGLKNLDDRDKVRDCLEKTKKSGSLLLSLINSVLDMSRIESGNAKLEEKPGDVLYSFANIEATMKEIAASKDIDLTFEISGVQDRYVFVDYDRASRIFVNLISNAVKYTKAGGYVRVRCEQAGRNAEHGIYRYTFEDNGIGMSEEFQKHMFEEFSREETSTASGIQGTGLGLSVVKAFIGLMGGTIECESRQGVGTKFTVILPFRLQDVDKTAYIHPDTGEKITAGMRQKTQPDFIDFTGKRVLLVEDNEMNREIAVDILEEEGLVVEKAEDGSIAVDMVREKGADYYDFILMDIQMPVMNGYEATKAIRAFGGDFAKLPVIAVSANAFEEDKAASLAAGMNDHVAKPIDVGVLMRVLARFMKD